MKRNILRVGTLDTGRGPLRYTLSVSEPNFEFCFDLTKAEVKKLITELQNILTEERKGFPG